MAADNLVTQAANAAAVMMLTWLRNDDISKIPGYLLYQWWEIILNANMFYVSWNEFSATRVNALRPSDAYIYASVN